MPIKTNPVILALDLSIACTGYALHDLDGTTHGAQSFAGKAGANPARRFLAFARWIDAMLRLHQPDIVLYEESDPRRMKSGAGVICAVGLRTLVEMGCCEREIPTRQIMPNSLKKQFCGDGRADKEQMKAAAAARFSDYDAAKDKGGDVADALALIAVWLDAPEAFGGQASKSLEQTKL